MSHGITARAVAVLSVAGVLVATLLAAIGTHPRQATVGVCLAGGLVLFVSVAYAAGMALLRGLDQLRAITRRNLTARALVRLAVAGVATATVLAAASGYLA